jgi:hypothetical protein
MKTFDIKAVLFCFAVGLLLFVINYFTQPWGTSWLGDGLITALTVSGTPFLMWLVRSKSGVVIGSTIGLLLHYFTFMLVVHFVWQTWMAWAMYLNFTIWIGALGALLSPYMGNWLAKKQGWRYGLISFFMSWGFSGVALLYCIFE